MRVEPGLLVTISRLPSGLAKLSAFNNSPSPLRMQLYEREDMFSHLLWAATHTLHFLEDEMKALDESAELILAMCIHVYHQSFNSHEGLVASPNGT